MGKHALLVILIVITFKINLMAQSLYFASPKESVQMISELLINENWQQLSRYYYLTNANEAVFDSLKNGSYFIRTKKPEVAHPGGFWRFKKPFPPGFKFVNVEHLNADTIRVNLILEIDQGDGIMQQGQTYFHLRKSSKGYQVLL